MKLLKGAWKLLVAIKDGLVLLLLLLFFAAVFAGLRATRSADTAPTSGALLLAFDGPIVVQPAAADSLSMLSRSGLPHEYRLRTVVRALEAAAGDSHIKAVVLDLDNFGGGGQVSMERVASALDKVRAAGKPVLAYATLYDDDSYLLAAHASEVWLSPLGMVGATGPGGTQLYYKGLIDKLGAKVHVYRVGSYKSAVEPYTRANMSPDARAANDALVKAVWDDWLGNVGKARPRAKIAAYLADPVAALKAADGDAAKAALNAALVDKLGDQSAFGARVAQVVGTGEDQAPGGFAAVPFTSYVARHPAPKGGEVGVITVAGDIVDGQAGPGRAGGQSIADLIDKAVADKAIKALVLRVDSPGGSVNAAEQIRNALLAAKAKKLPIVVSMANVAASGGYWISTPADAIYAEPATITGSIGVFAIIPSFEDTLAKAGITTDSVKATPLSGEPNILGGISPQFDALAQASVDDIYRRFTGIVAKSRKLPIARVDEIAQGRVWDGGTAHQLGLVDRFGSLDDAVAAAAKLAGLSGSAAQARPFDPPVDPLAQLLARLGQRIDAPSFIKTRAPTNWLDLAGRQQQQAAVRAAADLRGLVRGPAMRADCLECRAFAGPSALDQQAAQRDIGWLGRLAMWFGGAQR